MLASLYRDLIRFRPEFLVLVGFAACDLLCSLAAPFFLTGAITEFMQSHGGTRGALAALAAIILGGSFAKLQSEKVVQVGHDVSSFFRKQLIVGIYKAPRIEAYAADAVGGYNHSADALSAFLTGPCVNILTAVPQLMICAILGWYMLGESGIYCLVILLVAVSGYLHSHRRVRSNMIAVASLRLDIERRIACFARNISEIKSWGTASEEAGDLQKLADESHLAVLAMTRSRGLMTFFVGLLHCSIPILLIISVHREVANLNVGGLVATQSYLWMSLGKLLAVAGFREELASAKHHWKLLYRTEVPYTKMAKIVQIQAPRSSSKVDQVEIDGGEFILLRGPNAIGKSVFLRSICSVERLADLKVKANATLIVGNDPHPEHVRIYCSRSGYIPPRSFLNRFGHRDLMELSNRAGVLGLEEVFSLYIASDAAFLSTLSTGMIQRLSFFLACALSPKVLALDEALSSVDEEGCENLVRFARERLKGCTVIIVDHGRRISFSGKEADGVVCIDLGLAEQRSHFVTPHISD